MNLDLLLNEFKSSKRQRKGSLNDSQNLEEIFAEGFSSPDCNACTQAAIRFFTVKYGIYNCTEIVIRFFYSKMQNFENCTQTVICFSQRNKNLENFG